MYVLTIFRRRTRRIRVSSSFLLPCTYLYTPYIKTAHNTPLNTSPRIVATHTLLLLPSITAYPPNETDRSPNSIHYPTSHCPSRRAGASTVVVLVVFGGVTGPTGSPPPPPPTPLSSHRGRTRRPVARSYRVSEAFEPPPAPRSSAASGPGVRRRWRRRPVLGREGVQVGVGAAAGSARGGKGEEREREAGGGRSCSSWGFEGVEAERCRSWGRPGGSWADGGWTLGEEEEVVVVVKKRSERVL